jgi:hypothetical protein
MTGMIQYSPVSKERTSPNLIRIWNAFRTNFEFVGYLSFAEGAYLSQISWPGTRPFISRIRNETS